MPIGPRRMPPRRFAGGSRNLADVTAPIEGTDSRGVAYIGRARHTEMLNSVKCSCWAVAKLVRHQALDLAFEGSSPSRPANSEGRCAMVAAGKPNERSG